MKKTLPHNWNPIVSDQWAVDYISANGGDFNLYSSNVVLDVAVGQILIETAGGTATLNLQLEESDDLVSRTNAGPPEVWSWPVDGEKKFFASALANRFLPLERPAMQGVFGFHAPLLPVFQSIRNVV